MTIEPVREKTTSRKVAVVCECGADMTLSITTAGGNHRRVRVHCGVCGLELDNRVQTLESVGAWVTGEKGCGYVTVGSIWA